MGVFFSETRCRTRMVHASSSETSESYRAIFSNSAVQLQVCYNKVELSCVILKTTVTERISSWWLMSVDVRYVHDSVVVQDSGVVNCTDSCTDERTLVWKTNSVIFECKRNIQTVNNTTQNAQKPSVWYQKSKNVPTTRTPQTQTSSAAPGNLPVRL